MKFVPQLLRAGSAILLLLVSSALVAAEVGATSPPNTQDDPEAHYIAERDAYRTTLRRADANHTLDEKALYEKDRKAIAALTKSMRALIGPVEIAGVEGEGRLLPDSTLEGIGDVALDSLAYGETYRQIQVTTERILTDWLAAWQKDARAGRDAIPLDAAAALHSPTFYTFATSGDTGVDKFIEVPLKKSAQAKVAIAMLAGRTQGAILTEPESILVAAAQGGLVFIAEAPLNMKFGLLPACAAELHGPDDDVSTPAFATCFVKNAPKHPAFAAAVKQAQALYDRFPAK